MTFDLEQVLHHRVVRTGEAEGESAVPSASERSAAIAAAEEALAAAKAAHVQALRDAKTALDAHEKALATAEAAQATLDELGAGIEHLESQLAEATEAAAAAAPKVKATEAAADAAADAVDDANDELERVTALPVGVVYEKDLPRPYRVVAPADPISHNTCRDRLSLWLNAHGVVIKAEYA
ncbi:uncharacterized protein AMSG_02270 [Thecamonas trahens ATCC 50062]|uniref:Uncharacterized protein n=1 Tax=Thecamonas trahens ATCC 50062 TaxID=461836 RepID=A0A0L0DVQ1_THETB|nr:hypothetical protein AMSG_02270 [Thecamonas trahens ATCC 50062]KNC56300.1 hypothetical protein AMSG_02270 [Thecamonas trahens ATCC 50062]|eukprot:XP_013760819.1 hypothetical protein AMSG_02270 [Thecamonas trahens ATCC 50062]